jgi:hypothetical protein
MADKPGWLKVPLELAKQHPLYGAKGWLYLVAAGCLIMPLRNAVTLYPTYSSLDFAALDPLISSFIYVEIAVNVAVGLWALANLYLLLSLNPVFPLSFMAMAAFGGAFVPIDAAVAKFVFDASGQPMTWEETYDQETLREVARSIVYAAVWIPYMIVSRRVNVTFRHRVKADDPLVAPKAAAEA